MFSNRSDPEYYGHPQPVLTHGDIIALVGIVSATILAGATLWCMRRRRYTVNDPESPPRNRTPNGSDEIELHDVERPIFRFMEWYHDESASVECQTAWEAELPIAMRYRTEWRYTEV